MAETELDISTWARRDAFELFRSYEKPHYSVTTRLDVSQLMEDAKPRGVSTYRACLYAIGAGIHSVPELMVRFRGDTIVQHDAVELSMTVPLDGGGFGYAYVPFIADFQTFDKTSEGLINSVAAGSGLSPNTGERDDLIYLSCLPWLDFTSLNNAMPGPDDCIPRVGWGKFVRQGSGWEMAVAIEVHHALIDGEQLGLFFKTLQHALNRV